MERTRLDGRTIAVLGLARSGVAASRLARARGAAVYASDAADTPALRAAADALRALGCEVRTGGHDLDRIRAASALVLSPGIPPRVAPVRAAAEAGVPVVSELEFGWGLMGAGTTVAITGTNGKTTVTALAAALLAEAGIDAPAGGNIGTAASDLAMRDAPPAVAVLECSSFQLGATVDFRPDIGVLTNLAPDHLDWYASLDAYYGDKARLFARATAASRWILNGEDDAARALPGDAPGTRYHFRVASAPPDGERGGFVDGDGWLTLRLDGAADERLVPAGELRILGPHNQANALAAALVARLAGADAEAVRRGLRAFRAPPHRMEPVAETGGVLWVNDSKATNVASTRVAIRGVGRPAVLLLGGKHKGEPYTELLPDLAGRVRAVVAYGEAAPLIEADLAGRVPLERVDGPFEAVVARARALARPGDAVLLSPACSSFDQFENYEARGRRFAELAREGGE